MQPVHFHCVSLLGSSLWKHADGREGGWEEPVGTYGVADRYINYTGPLKSGCTVAHVVYLSVTLQCSILLAQGIQLFSALFLFHF